MIDFLWFNFVFITWVKVYTLYLLHLHSLHWLLLMYLLYRYVDSKPFSFLVPLAIYVLYGAFMLTGFFIRLAIHWGPRALMLTVLSSLATHGHKHSHNDKQFGAAGRSEIWGGGKCRYSVSLFGVNSPATNRLGLLQRELHSKHQIRNSISGHPNVVWCWYFAWKYATKLL